MSERPTPETDALIISKGGFGMTDYEWREHSRRLERERDEAIARSKEWSDWCVEYKSERDEARKEIETLRSHYADKSKEACDLVFENRSLRIALQEIESMAKKKLDELSTY